MWLVYAWRVLTGGVGWNVTAKLAGAVSVADRPGPVARRFAGAGLFRLSIRTVMPFLLQTNSQCAAFSACV